MYECSPEYGSRSNADHTELVVKIKELQKLSRALHVAPLALRLCQVEEGCLLLPFPGALICAAGDICFQGLYLPLSHMSLVYD